MSSLLHMLVCASLLHIRAHGVFPSVAMTTFTCAWIMRLFPITRVRTYVKLLLPFTCNFHYSLRVVVNFSTAIIHIPHCTATQKEQVCLQAAVLIYLHLMRNDFVWQYSTLFGAIEMWWNLFAYTLPLRSRRFWMRVRNRDWWQRVVFSPGMRCFLPLHQSFLICILLQVRVPSFMYITGVCALWSERQYCD